MVENYVKTVTIAIWLAIPGCMEPLAHSPKQENIQEFEGGLHKAFDKINLKKLNYIIYTLTYTT